MSGLRASVERGCPAGVSPLAARLAALTGWRRLGLLFLFGVLAAGALPPLFLVPLLIPAFCGLLWMLDGAVRLRGAFAIGWLFSFGYFVAGLYWVGIAMTVDLAQFGWFMPVSVIGLSAGLALFHGAAVALVWRIGWRGGGRVLLLSAAWLGAEFLRGTLLTGFPWNLLGTVWAFHPLTLQAAAWLGVWGLGAVTLLAAAAPSVLGEPGGRGRGLFVAAAYGLLALMLAGGAWRLAAAPASGEAVVPEVMLRLVQPSIPQHLKWVPEQRRENLERQFELSMQPAAQPITHVIWPETAVPYFLNEQPELARALGRLVPPGGAAIVGAPAVAREGDGGRLYNSLFVIAPDGTTAQRYDKFHLVPFGEYVPLRDWLGFAKVTAGRTDFSAGPGLARLAVPGLPPASPLICYEIIFSGRVVPAGEPRPRWLLNVTNDGWFGLSSGPYQHFASARLRAVEEGLPLVRAANNGISAIVDPYGRIQASLPLDAVGVLDGALPRALAVATPYARLGRWAVPLLLLAFLALGWPLRRGFPR